MEKVAILGAGLLGASLARALKAKGDDVKISVWSRSQSTRDKCKALVDVFDSVCESPTDAVKDADITVLCTPTANIPELAKEISSALKKGSILTDVGSVKKNICIQCKKALENNDATFVGSHPMAGSEKIGVDFSDEKLFNNRPCFITTLKNHTKNEEFAALKLTELWESVGMKAYRITPELHDAIVARVSHAPHLLAGTLCICAAKFADADLTQYVGPGFRDTTRVASGSPDMWDSIVSDNKDEILHALKDYRKELDSLISDMENTDKTAMANRLRTAKKYRDSIK